MADALGVGRVLVTCVLPSVIWCRGLPYQVAGWASRGEPVELEQLRPAPEPVAGSEPEAAGWEVEEGGEVVEVGERGAVGPGVAEAAVALGAGGGGGQGAGAAVEAQVSLEGGSDRAAAGSGPRAPGVEGGLRGLVGWDESERAELAGFEEVGKHVRQCTTRRD